MDWFEKITGFIEKDYDQVHNNISVTGQNLLSKVNQMNYSIGCFECLSLKELRNKTFNQIRTEEKSSCSIVIDDVRNLLNSATNNGSIFQVASQFNCLEMVSPDVTPEQGITRYEWDRTQGPACSIAAGAATIYRNYFIPIDKDFGQTTTRQINNLDSLTEKLAEDMNCSTSDLWFIKNGYVITNEKALNQIDTHLSDCNENDLDQYRQLLKIGVHWDVQVTTSFENHQPIVTQVFCSALPVAYNKVNPSSWSRIAQLILDASYEATLLTGIINKKSNGNNSLFLTLLGGGVFGNKEEWIQKAIIRALEIVKYSGLDIKIVSFSEPSNLMKEVINKEK